MSEHWDTYGTLTETDFERMMNSPFGRQCGVQVLIRDLRNARHERDEARGRLDAVIALAEASALDDGEMWWEEVHAAATEGPSSESARASSFVSRVHAEQRRINEGPR